MLAWLPRVVSWAFASATKIGTEEAEQALDVGAQTHQKSTVTELLDLVYST
jgi:hypothetical protein